MPSYTQTSDSDLRVAAIAPCLLCASVLYAFLDRAMWPRRGAACMVGVGEWRGRRVSTGSSGSGSRFGRSVVVVIKSIWSISSPLVH